MLLLRLHSDTQIDFGVRMQKIFSNALTLISVQLCVSGQNKAGQKTVLFEEEGKDGMEKMQEEEKFALLQVMWFKSTLHWRCPASFL